MKDTIHSLDNLFFTPLELESLFQESPFQESPFKESLFQERILDFNKHGAKLKLINASDLGEKTMIGLIPTEAICVKGKKASIQSIVSVILYDKTPENIKILRHQKKQTETIIKCKVSTGEAYTFIDESELKSNTNLRKIIKPVNYELMSKMYRS